MHLPSLRVKPLDYRTGRPMVAEPAPGGVDVVVPIYGAADEFARCLETLLAHTDFTRHGLIAVLDGPGQDAQATALEAARARLGDADPVRVLVNDARLGFVGSVNRGMAASSRDVVLLNSDTEVTPGWLEKLQAAAWSAPEIATVTPFCNDATLVSLPEPFASNRLPAGYDAGGFARLIEQVAERSYPRLPTGVGVCLYIKRRALETVGPFDAGAFGLGYGEENDFCLRALTAGCVHVLDDATFIYHAGHRSFGNERRALMRRAERRLRQRHPAYFATVAAFMRDDPLAPVRRRVTDELARRAGHARVPTARPGRVLHVVHGWPPFASGGTEQYASWLAHEQARRRDVAIYARLSAPERRDGEADELRDGALRVRLVVNDFTARNPLVRNGLVDRAGERDFARFVDNVRPDLVHVHHLAGHSLRLLSEVARRGLPLVVQMQDWWLACARTNLLRPDGALCSGPGLRKCARCRALTHLPPLGLPNLALHALRRGLVQDGLRRVDAFVAGSRFIAETWRDWGLVKPGDAVHVLPYGVPSPAACVRARRTELPLRFGVVGTLMPHKGAHVAVAAFEGVAPQTATLDLWGAESAAPTYARELRAAAGPSVRFRGAFDEADKTDVLASLDVLIVPSVGLESFGLVAREALALGVPVLASRLGALNELIDAGGALGFAAGDAAELRAKVLELAAAPQRLDALRAAAKPVKTIEEHAEEIEAVYAEVLARSTA